MTNRIIDHAKSLVPKIAELSSGAYANLDAELAIEPMEHFAFQEQQARAHASGILTTEEAQTVYLALGEIFSDSNGGWQPHVDLSLKVSITLLIKELLEGRR